MSPALIFINFIIGVASVNILLPPFPTNIFLSLFNSCYELIFRFGKRLFLFFTFLKPYNTSKTQKYFQVGKNVKNEYCYLPILSMEAKLSAKSAIAG